MPASYQSYFFSYNNGTWTRKDSLPCHITITARTTAEARNKLQRTVGYRFADRMFGTN